MVFVLFFFNETATTEIYTLSLHDALPIWLFAAVNYTINFTTNAGDREGLYRYATFAGDQLVLSDRLTHRRSEEHTSELQSRQYLVCRLLLEKKKQCTHVKQTTPKTQTTT